MKIARLFEGSTECRISAREDRVFGDRWLSLGTVSLGMNDKKAGELIPMVRNGAFEWRLPSARKAQDELFALLGAEEDQRESLVKVVARALDNIASVGVRTGLLHPVFDPEALEEMPFRRSTSVVSDTSGVLQGALDFVVRHLHPPTRVNVPTIVQMELVNAADRFFGLRRSVQRSAPKRRANELIEHLRSQGGQRALLRLELQADAEIERTYLLGDPLRSAFQPERDSDLSDLNLSVSITAYVDRLILEAARHRQAQSGPNHTVRLLTGDQGLARMALAEGVSPLYFSAVKAADFFDERLTGQTFDPFSGRVRRTSLASVLWELATAFGSARLENEQGQAFSIFALGEEMSWSPYHSFDDLLWCRYRPAALRDDPPDLPPSRSSRAGRTDPVHVPREGAIVPAGARQPRRRASFARFSVDRMLRLICALDDDQTMSEARIVELLGVGSRRTSDEYRRFLESAHLIHCTREGWQAKPALQMLSAALRNERMDEFRNTLRKAPSFAEFAARVEQAEIGRVLDLSDMGRGRTTCQVLGEMTLLCAGLYPTPAMPDAAAFAPIAFNRFSELDGGDGLVSTGAWLESLIQKDGIHPEIARRRLDEASAKGLLRRATEGSTTQVRFRDRVVHVLRLDAGDPIVVPVHLYQGDYLIPGKGSVSLHIEDPTP